MDLSPKIVQWLTSLRMNTQHGEPRPHKPVLLLAVLELAENDQLSTNAVRLEPALFEYFADYWTAVSGDVPSRIEYPFWYMKSEPFWTFVPLPGQEEAVRAKGSQPVSGKWLHEHIAFARLDPILFEALGDTTVRDRIRGALVARYFPERAERIAEIRAFEQSVYRYSQIVRRLGEAGVAYRTAPEFVRSTAFRRTVTEAYDYTCAVSGTRLTLPAGTAYQLVEAAHIHDWADSHNDDPRNGLSLSRDYHWMFEQGLFTLDERWRVRVSPVARDCIGTVDTLLTRYGRRPIRLPEDESRWPGQEYLEWHRATKYRAG